MAVQTANVPPAEPVVKKESKLASVAKFREIGLLIFIILLAIGVQIRNSSFLTVENVMDMATNTAILSILAVGMMLVLVTRGIDLSIGATLALSGMLVAQIVSINSGFSPVLAVITGIGIGIFCGLIIGGLVSWLGVLPIIATLAMMNIYRGFTYMVSDGKWISSYQMSESFVGIATSSILGINTLILIAIFIYIAAYYFISHTRTGRHIYAVGSNPESAKVTGINEKKILMLVYTLMGGLSGLCGVLWVSKFASAQGDTASGFELSVIAACILGGVSIAGGSGKLSGVILGAVLIGILNNALPLMNVSPFWQKGVEGTIILVAVLLNVAVKRGVERNHLLRRRI
ncbi:ABC transporter permease [Domibacillus robiginosus]|uniref:ABC transporter permease n=1 Tax=Domibacillus robiginosus TaxID=1071054 RepID=UPI00067B6205|nr:ABC transporter permease [Domibacillus robiginosus]